MPQWPVTGHAPLRADALERPAADGTMRGRIAQLNSKLGKLERQMQLVEATLESVDQEEAQ